MSVLLTALLLLVPIQSESGQFTILQNGRKIGTETFTIKERSGGYLVEGKTQLERDSAPFTSKLELDAQLNPTDYQFQHGEAAIHLKIEASTAEFERTVAGKKTTDTFRFPEGGVLLDTNFFHHYVVLFYKLNGRGGVLPVVVPQDFQNGLLTVRQTAEHVFELVTEGVTMEATTDPAGKLLRLAVPAAKVVIER